MKSPLYPTGVCPTPVNRNYKRSRVYFKPRKLRDWHEMALGVLIGAGIGILFIALSANL